MSRNSAALRHVRFVFLLLSMLLALTPSWVVAQNRAVFNNVTINTSGGQVSAGETLRVNVTGRVKSSLLIEAMTKAELRNGNTVLATFEREPNYNQNEQPINDDMWFDLTAQLPVNVYQLYVRAYGTNGGWGDSQTFPVTITGTSSTHEAKFVEMLGLPTSMNVGATASVSITMRNTGSTTWTPATKFYLGSQSPENNYTWGMNRVAVPKSVAPGQEVTFNFSIKAPSAAGSYNFQWKMLQEDIKWFGDFVPATARIISVSKPNVAPTATLISPTTYASYEVAPNDSVSVRVRGSASDSDGRISAIAIVDNTSIILSTNASTIDKTIPLPVGAHKLGIRATDDSGAIAYSSTVSIDVVSSSGGPVFTSTVATPSSGNVVGDGKLSVTVSGRVKAKARNDTVTLVEIINVDTGSRYATIDYPITYTADGGVIVNEERSIGETIQLAAGSHRLRVTARTDGNSSGYVDLPVTVTKVNAPPTVTMTAPTANATYDVATSAEKKSIVVNGTASDIDGPTPKIEILDNDAVITGATVGSAVALGVGSHKLQLRATDDKGATTKSTPAITITVRVPNRPPTVTVTSPTADSALTVSPNGAASVPIIATASDPDDGLSSFVLLDNGTQKGSYPSGVANETIALYAGNHSLKFVATDKAGAKTESNAISVQVTEVQGSRMFLTNSISPVNAELVSTSTLKVTAKATAKATGRNEAIERISLVDVRNPSNEKILYSYDFGVEWDASHEVPVNDVRDFEHDVNLKAGVYDLILRAQTTLGTAGETLPVRVTIVQKNGIPVVSMTSPVGSQLIEVPPGQMAAVKVMGSATDPEGAALNIQVIDNGAVIAGASLGSTLQLALGEHHLKFRATDPQGLAAESEPEAVVTVKVANKLPTVSMTSPAADAVYIAAPGAAYPLQVSGTASDPEGAIKKIEVLNMGVPIGEMTGGTLSLTLPLERGGYPLKLRATDMMDATAETPVVNIQILQDAGGITLRDIGFVPGVPPAPGAQVPVSVKALAKAVQRNDTVTRLEIWRMDPMSLIAAVDYDAELIDGTPVNVERTFDDTILLAPGRHNLIIHARSYNNAEVLSATYPVQVGGPTPGRLLGGVSGIRTAASGSPELFGWACDPGSTSPLAYTVLLDGPSPGAGGIQLASGVANVSGEPDSASVQAQCGTPGSGHHFVVDLSSYVSQYAGRKLYVWASTANGANAFTLPCADNMCTMPGSLRVALSTPSAGDRVSYPNPVFMRMQLTNGSGSYDEVGFVLDGEYIAAQPDGAAGAYSASKNGLPVRAAPYTVFAKVRQGGTTVMSVQNDFTVVDGGPTTIALGGIASGATIPIGTTRILQAITTGTVVQSVEFDSNGKMLGVARRDNETWTYNWTPALAGNYAMTARALDGNGGLLATSTAVNVIVNAATSATPIPIVVDVPQASNGEGGTLPGEVTVGSDGGSAYAIPIQLPPGILDMVPALSLAYSSNSPSTIAGLGWSLNGVSRIDRCGKIMATDGKTETVRFSGTSAATTLKSDRLCLDGARLVIVNDSATDDAAYWADGAEYRTEVESFARVTALLVGGKRAFKVETKDGRTSYYGDTADSYIEAVGRSDGLAHRWYISRTADRSGNSISYTYDEDANGGNRPASISWGGNTTQNTSHFAKVTFTYETRPDPRIAYIAGSRSDDRSRLKTIQTTVDSSGSGSGTWITALSYTLGYGVSPSSGRSLLQSVSACDASRCLPTTTFKWGERDPMAQRAFASLGTNRTGPNLTPPGYTGYERDAFIAADFNGDGKTDLLERGWYGSAGVQRLFTSSADGKSWTTTTPFAGSNINYVLEAGDFDGDGLIDLLVNTTSNQWLICFGKGFAKGACEFSTALSLPTEVIKRESQGEKLRMARDFNADGKDDLYVRTFVPPASTAPSGYRAYQCLSTGSGFHCTEVTTGGYDVILGDQTNGEPFSPSAFADVDADGRVDLVSIAKCAWTFVRPENVSRWICGTNGYGDEQGGIGVYGSPEPGGVRTTGGWLPFASQQTGTTPPMSHGTVIGDQNADGYSDLVLGVVSLAKGATITSGNLSLCLSKGDGSGECRNLPNPELGGAGSRNYLMMTVGDFDGDGVVDILRPSGDSWSMANASGYLLCHIGTDTAVSSAELPLFQRCEQWSGPIFYSPPQQEMFKVTNPMVAPASMFLGDFDGDGTQDIATYLGGEQWQIHAAVSQAKPNEALDKLIAVTNGLGNIQRIEYALPNDGSVYQATVVRDDGANAVGKLVYPSRPLVKAIRRDNGIAESRATTFSYARMAMDSGGRGNLGFAQIISTDVQRGVTATTWPCLSFPNIGNACASKQVSAADVELANTGSMWDQKSISQTNGITTFFPYLRISTTTRKDAGGNDLGTTTLINTPDEWGNLLSTSTSTSTDETADFWRTSESSKFDNNATTWRLGERISRTEIRTKPTSSITRQSTYTYDAQGRLASETRVSSDNAQRLKTTYGRSTATFGAVGKITLDWTGVDGKAQSRTVSDATFTPNGRFVSSVKNAAAQVERRTFDPRTGKAATVTDANGLTVSTVSDGFGRVTSITGPDGTIAETSYRNCAANCPDGATNVMIHETKRAGDIRTAVPVVTFGDNAGRVVRRMSWGFDGSKVTADTVFDALGRTHKVYWPRYVTDAEAVSSISSTPAGVLQAQTTYDVLDRPLQIQNIDEGGSTRTLTHTWSGFVHETVNPKSQKIVETRDRWGQLVSTTDANSKTTLFAFDGFGNLTETTDPVKNKVKFTYDDWGRKKSLDDPDLGLITYDVDPLGQTWQQVSPNQRASNKATVMAFDVLGRMTSRTSEDTSATWAFDVLPGQTSCATYRSCGKLVRASTQAGTTTLDYREEFTYDAAGRPSTTTRYLDVAYLSTITYDAWGRPIREHHQRGSDAPKAYDRRYNAWGQLSRIERNGTGLWDAATVDASGRLTSALLGNGLTSVQVFNGYTGRLSDGSVNAGVDMRLHEAYQYDVLGNVSQRLQAWGSTLFTENFEYDQLNRLKSSTILGYAAQAFTYDDIGNVKSKTGVGSGNYEYPSAGAARPHAVSNIPGIGSFAYDNNGNLTSGAGRTVTWTSFDMPRTIAKGGETSTFYYGADRQRVKQVRSDGVTFWYSGAIEVEVSGGSVKVKTYLPSNLGVEIESAGTSKVYYTHLDRLGSVMALSDEAGMLSEQLAYDAWGKRRQQATPSTPDSIDGQIDNKGFTGHEMLDKVDLVHMNGRVYDPLVVRFLSADPVIQDLLHSQSYNRYSYVWNNPTNLTDPSGFIAMGSGSGFNSYDNDSVETENSSRDLGERQTSSEHSRDRSGTAPPMATPSVTVVGTKAQVQFEQWFFEQQLRTIYGTPRERGNAGGGTLQMAVPAVVAGSAIAVVGCMASKPCMALLRKLGKFVWDAIPVLPIADSGADDTNSEGATDGEKTGDKTNPYKGPVDQPVVVVDQHGNAIPVKPGEQVKGSPNGDYQQVLAPDGKPTGDRLDRGGHKNQNDPRAQLPHGHRPGVTTPDGNPHLPIYH